MKKIEGKIDNIVLIPCSGSEYHGELARQVAIDLAEKSEISTLATMTCSTIFLKNILLEKDQMIEITKNHLKNSFLIMINGCKTACVTQIYNHLGIHPDLVIYVQDMVPKQRINLNDLNTFKNTPKLSEIKVEDKIKVKEYILKKLKNLG